MRREIDHALDAVLELKMQAIIAERFAATISFSMISIISGTLENRGARADVGRPGQI